MKILAVLLVVALLVVATVVYLNQQRCGKLQFSLSGAQGQCSDSPSQNVGPKKDNPLKGFKIPKP